MRCGILSVEKNKCWLLKAVSRQTGRTLAWVIGGRDVATFKRLYEKVKHLETCEFYTDEWRSFAKVLPQARHKISRRGTVSIEHDNSNTRHHLGRFTPRTKIVSKKVERVDAAIKLWCALTTPEIFQRYQKIALSIFT
jgi:insertion element IS1 protein InsB